MSKSENKRKSILRKIILLALLAISIAILTSAFFISLIQNAGNSMQPTLENKDIILFVKNADLRRGDIVSFEHENKLLIKRVIGLPGDVIRISKEGKLYINGEDINDMLGTDNTYTKTGDIEYPFTVPDNRYFVISDNAETSVDSRISEVGCISEEKITGKAFARIWPIKNISLIKSGN